MAPAARHLENVFPRLEVGFIDRQPTIARVECNEGGRFRVVKAYQAGIGEIIGQGFRVRGVYQGVRGDHKAAARLPIGQAAEKGRLPGSPPAYHHH